MRELPINKNNYRHTKKNLVRQEDLNPKLYKLSKYTQDPVYMLVKCERTTGNKQLEVNCTPCNCRVNYWYAFTILISIVQT